MDGIRKSDLTNVAWGPTLRLNFARSVSSATVLTAMMLMSGYRASGDPIAFFVAWSAAAFVAVPLMQIMVRGIGAVVRRIAGPLGWAFDLTIWLMQVIPGIAMAVGDPIVYIVNRSAPNLFNVGSFGLFNLKALIFVVREPQAEGHPQASHDAGQDVDTAIFGPAAQPAAVLNVHDPVSQAANFQPKPTAMDKPMATPTRLPRRTTSEGHIACPYCAEEIRYEAIKCRFCGEAITDGDRIGLPSFLITFANLQHFDRLIADYKRHLFGDVPATILDVNDMLREVRLTSEEALAEQWKIDCAVLKAMRETVLADGSPLWDVRIYSIRFIDLITDFYSPHFKLTAESVSTHYLEEFEKLRRQVDEDTEYLSDSFRGAFSELIGFTIDGCREWLARNQPPKDDLLAAVRTPPKRLTNSPSGRAGALGVFALLLLIGGAGVFALSMGWIRFGGSSEPIPTIASTDSVPPPPLAQGAADRPMSISTTIQLATVRGTSIDAPDVVAQGERIEVGFALGPAAKSGDREFGYALVELMGDSLQVQTLSANLPLSADERSWHWSVVPTEAKELTLNFVLSWWPPGIDLSTGVEPESRSTFAQRMVVVRRGELPIQTEGPYLPAAPVTVKGTDVRFRASPQANAQVPIVGEGNTGDLLNVVGVSMQSDWSWYQVRLADGSKAYVRSDLTSAPLPGKLSSDSGPVPSIDEDASLATPAQILGTKPKPGRAFKRPVYPPASKAAGEEGETVLSMCVDANGRASDIKIVRSSGFPRLDEASVIAMRENVFDPATDSEGKPMAMCDPPYQLTYMWALN